MLDHPMTPGRKPAPDPATAAEAAWRPVPIVPPLPAISEARRTATGAIAAIIDGQRLVVPDDLANGHRQSLAAWEAAGNVIAPYVPPALAEADYAAAITAHIEATARARGYDGALSLASYVASTNPTWAAEAAAFLAWRDAVWAAAYAALAGAKGVAPAPTIEGFIAALPKVEWPG